MTEKNEGAPCAAEFDTEEDSVLAKETDADFEAEETNAKEVPSA